MLYISLLELLLLYPTSFGMVCFHFHLSQDIFYSPSDFFFLIFTNWLFCGGFFFNFHIWKFSNFPSVGSDGKESAHQLRRYKRHRLNPWVVKIPRNRKWQPTPVCLENPIDRGAWWATVHGATKSQTDWVTEYTHIDFLKSHTIVVVNDTWYDFNLSKFLVCGLTYTLSWRMFHVYMKTICIQLLLDGWSMYFCYIHLVYGGLPVHTFLIDFSVWIVLSIVENEVLNSFTIIILLVISPFSSINICFIFSGAPVLGYQVHIYL